VLGPLGILFVFKECTGFAQAYRLRFKPGGSDSSLEAEIQACRLRFKPGGSDSGLEAEVHPWLELLPGSLPKTSRILVLLVLFVLLVFLRFYLFFSGRYRFCLVKYNLYKEMKGLLSKTNVFYEKVMFCSIKQQYPMKVCSSLLAQIQAWRLRFKPGG